MMRFLLPAALAVALLTGSAKAYTIMGAGLSSCGTWTAERPRPGSELNFVNWFLGFVSGVAYGGDEETDPLNGVDLAGVEGWIDNYCRANALKQIKDAAKAFIREHPH